MKAPTYGEPLKTKGHDHFLNKNKFFQNQHGNRGHTIVLQMLSNRD